MQTGYATLHPQTNKKRTKCAESNRERSEHGFPSPINKECFVRMYVRMYVRNRKQLLGKSKYEFFNFMVGLRIKRLGENKNIFLFEEEKFFFIFALDMSNFIREICNLKKYNIFHIVRLKNFFKLQVQLFLSNKSKKQHTFAQET